MAYLTACPHCGWQNDAASRVCGGCGQPLRTTGAPFDVTQTVPLQRPARVNVGGPQPYRAPSETANRPTPRWPEAAQAPVVRGAAPQRTRPRRAGSCLARGLLGIAIAMLLVLVLAGTVWALAVRPFVHAQVDGAIGTGLEQAIGAIPPIPDQALQVLGTRFSVSAADVNAVVANELPRGQGLDNMAVTFNAGDVVLSYSAYGQPGTIQTTLQVRQGALVATGTQVSGLLGWVESGDELQATLDRALSQLQTKTPHGFQSVAVAPGVLTVVLRSA